MPIAGGERGVGYRDDFVERNNPCPESERRDVLSANEGNELVANWGNLANLMLSCANKRFDGHVPEPGDLDASDRALLAKAMALAREANVYLDRKAPWFQL